MTKRGFPAHGAHPSLPGMAEPVATDRLFLGLFPDQAAKVRIEQVARQLPRELCPPGPVSRAARYHVTLHHLGDHAGLTPGLVDAALAATGRIHASVFDIVMDHVSSFRGGRKHPLVLRCPEDSPAVHGLWSAAHAMLAETIFARWLDRRFTPHLTLAYGDRMASEPIRIDPIAWRVEEIVLVHSLLGRSEYRILGVRRLALA